MGIVRKTTDVGGRFGPFANATYSRIERQFDAVAKEAQRYKELKERLSRDPKGLSEGELGEYRKLHETFQALNEAEGESSVSGF